MALIRPVQDSEFYHKRTQALLASGYPISVADYDFSMYDGMTRWHWHEEIEIQYIVDGSLYVTCGENSFLAKKGDIVFINRQVKHFNTPVNDVSCTFRVLIVNVSFIFGFGQLEMENKYINPIIFNSKFKYLHFTPKDSAYDNYMTHLSEIFKLNNLKPDCYEMLTKAELIQLWAIIYDKLPTNIGTDPDAHYSTLDEQRVNQAISFIKEHYTEPITLADIADSILISKSECCRCFKRTMNVTPFEYLMKYRIIESTKRMLKKPNESISEIAVSVGFNNTSYYNKIFKKYMGCTPTEYRHTS